MMGICGVLYFTPQCAVKELSAYYIRDYLHYDTAADSLLTLIYQGHNMLST